MYLGIDLGTSNSAIAGNSGSNLRLYKTHEGTDVLPSVIQIDKRGHKFIGTRAYNHVHLSPENVAQGFKRLMGTNNKVSFAAAELEMSPEECSTEIIRTLFEQARTEAGDFDVDGVVVTIPAAFNQMQSEATIRAASAAGLERVGLLQEPIAAAMASMVNSTSKNGQFLVYDLGGGTFDVALVQSMKGSVNIVAHEGINMLGGRDFDRMLLDESVRPWLMENFSLPINFQKDDRYRRVVSIARHATERAKIILSSTPTATIFAGEEEIRVQDADGKDIHLSIEVRRNKLDDLIAERVDESIELCRKVLKDNGYGHGDIKHLVFIGGPTKMPFIRDRVPRELGMDADLKTDPMTAVAIGAAIFAESREWSNGATTRKPSRASAVVTGAIEIRYDYPARVSEDQARVRVRLLTESEVGGYRLVIDTEEGWTSGQVDIAADLRVKVPVRNLGDNRYRITVRDPSGVEVTEACSEIVIFRTHASAAAISATRTLAVKVVEKASGKEQNELEPLVPKGTVLPAYGANSFRAAKNLRGGHAGQIDIDIFEQAEGVPEPELNLPVGSIQIDAGTDLEKGQFLRKGDEIIIHWKVDDNGLLICEVEVPSLELKLGAHNFYNSNAGHQDFEGENGGALVEEILADAERDLEMVKTTLGDKVATDVENMQGKLESQKTALAASSEAETRRSVTEQARAVRQQISRLKHSPDNRAKVLEQEMFDTVETFDQFAKEHAGLTSIDLFSRLSLTVQQAIRNSEIPEAERALSEMKGILQAELWRNPSYVVHVFKMSSPERHLAVDKALHDKLVAEGEEAVAAKNFDGLRRTIFQILENQFFVGGGDKITATMAGLMRN